MRVATIVFFGLFALAMYLGRNDTIIPGFAERMVGTEQLSQLEESYEAPLAGSLDHYVSMSGFYIMHNTGIGLRWLRLWNFIGSVPIFPRVQRTRLGNHVWLHGSARRTWWRQFL